MVTHPIGQHALIAFGENGAGSNCAMVATGQLEHSERYNPISKGNGSGPTSNDTQKGVPRSA